MKKKKILLYFLLSFILLFAVVVRFYFIIITNPYPRHVDEGFVAQPALDIAKTGDLNPKFFNYPSLSIYITAGLLVVFDQKNLDKETSVDYPYYQPDEIMLAPRFFWALISVCIILMTGIITFLFKKKIWIMLVTLLLLVTSHTFLYYSWEYLNVDILGTFFVILSILWLLYVWEKSSLITGAIIPGFLCGCAVASKYNLGLILLPFLLFYFLKSARKKLLYSYVFFSIFVLTFVLLVPYSVLDIPRFLHGLYFEINHYRTGHSGFEGDAGFPQLLYYLGQFINDFGIAALLLAAVGSVYIVKINWRKGLCFLSFPLALLVFMCSQRVHFVRNLLSLFAVLPVLISLGLYAVSDFFINFGKKHFIIKAELLKTLIFSLFLIFSLLTYPWDLVRKGFSVVKDSRNEAAIWIKKNIPKGSTLFVSKELQMSTSKLSSDFEVKEIAFKKFLASEKRDGYYILPLPGYTNKYIAHKEAVEDIIRDMEKFKKIKSFGKTPVKIFEAVPVRPGNPKLFICE